MNRNFARAIEKAKATHWQEWIDHTGGEDIWAIHRYMKVNPTDYGRQRIPDLKIPGGTTATSNEMKAKSLANTFFPPKRPLNRNKRPFTESNPPRAMQTKFPDLTPNHIFNTLMRINPHKAPGPLGIANVILKKCAGLLAPLLSTIYTAICKLKHMLARLRKIHQVVLPKPGHASYEIPSSYRPIALIKTIVKVLSTIVTEELSFECKTNNLLPEFQFGRRLGCSTTDALHIAEQYIRNSWRKGRVVAALFLDIQAAFPNMQKDKLLTNTQARNITPEYRDYVDMILTQQQIQLKFDDHVSAPFSPVNGCCQGCPLSMLLYVLYNAPLIQITDNGNPNECIIGYVDNTTAMYRYFSFIFLYAALFRCSRYTPLHHQPTIHRFSSISLIAVTHRASRLRCVDRRDLIAYMKCIRRMTCTDTIETHSRQRVSHDSAPPGFHTVTQKTDSQGVKFCL